MKKFVILLCLILSQAIYAAPRFASCNSSETRTLKNIDQNVNHRFDQILDTKTGVPYWNLENVKNEYVIAQDREPNPRFKNSDGTYKRFHSTFLRNLRLMNSKIKNGITYKCDSSFWAKNCRSGEVYAYVLFYGDRPEQKIHLCPIFFDENTISQQDTVLHELSHLAANTDHYMGTVFNDAGMIKSTTDAYLYEQFMDGDIFKALKRNSFGLLYRKRR
jgi:hypothetical protein